MILLFQGLVVDMTGFNSSVQHTVTEGPRFPEKTRLLFFYINSIAKSSLIRIYSAIFPPWLLCAVRNAPIFTQQETLQICILYNKPSNSRILIGSRL